MVGQGVKIVVCKLCFPHSKADDVHDVKQSVELCHTTVWHAFLKYNSFVHLNYFFKSSTVLQGVLYFFTVDHFFIQCLLSPLWWSVTYKFQWVLPCCYLGLHPSSLKQAISLVKCFTSSTTASLKVPFIFIWHSCSKPKTIYIFIVWRLKTIYITTTFGFEGYLLYY